MFKIFTWGSEYYAIFLGIVGFIFFMRDLVTSVGNRQQQIFLITKQHMNTQSEQIQEQDHIYGE